jgi:hypothetical protein
MERYHHVVACALNMGGTHCGHLLQIQLVMKNFLTYIIYRRTNQRSEFWDNMYVRNIPTEITCSA